MSGIFEAPHLSEVLNYPENPKPLLAQQLAAQFVAQGRLYGLDPFSPVPTVRGRTAVRETSARRPAKSAARGVSVRETPGAASSFQPEFLDLVDLSP